MPQRSKQGLTMRIDRAGADALGARFVGELAALGIGPSSRVALWAPSSIELLAASFGCLRAGLAPVVLSSGLTKPERDSMLSDVSPHLVVDEEMLLDLTAVDRRDSEPAELGDHFQCRPMHFTSGTSGRPKAVWSGWLDEAAASVLADEEDACWGFRSDDVHLVCSPLSHSAPLRFALHTLLAGGAVHVLPRFDVDAVLSAFEHGVTTTFVAPAQLQRLVDSERPLRAPDLRLIAHAGAACPPSLKRAVIETFGTEVVYEFYGSTEGQFTICPSTEWLEHPGTVGRPRPGREMRVVDGQLWCRPPAAARFEYWGAEEKTAQTWDGKWFTVGDLGRIDPEGYVFLEGRRDDLIITGGVNVYPAEVERILREMDGIDDVCVLGKDDLEWGERVCAVIIGSPTIEEIAAYGRTHLAPYKRPKSINKVDAFPTTHSGKTDRQALASELE